jgi:hypothetical protein
MKSFCLKSNNEELISYMIKNLEELDDVVISSNSFKIFKNVIVHYVGQSENYFKTKYAEILARVIEIFYEKNILEKIVQENYFYFEDAEKNAILQICEKLLEIQENEFHYKREILKGLIYEYFEDNKSMVLDGFVDFRLKPYFEILEYVVDTSVTNFVLSFK